MSTWCAMFKSRLPWKLTKTKVMVPERTMEDEPEHILQEQKLVACSTCGRTFLPLPLKKHAPICEKTAAKKRRVFDSLKQRVEGTDLAQFHQKTYLKKQDSTPKTADKSKWEESHRKLVDAIRSAKGASKQMSTKKTPVAASTSSSNERCPFCERQFGPKAFERHVEWCKEHRTRVQKSPANVLLAKERLDARIKYKVPPLAKAKRLTVKEKYSNTSIPTKTESICSIKSTPPNPPLKRSLSIRKPKSVLDLGKTSKSVVELDKKTQAKSTTTPTYDPFASAERQFKELLECDLQTTQRPHTAITNTKPLAKKTVKSAVSSSKKRASVIDPPASFQDADEFEVLENLINQQFNNELLNESFSIARKYSDTSSIDSSLINDNDNLLIPKHLKFDDYSSNDDDETDTTIRNTVESNKNETKSKAKTKKYCKNKTKSDCSYDEKGNNNKTSDEEVVEELFDVDDKLYAEYKIYEEMYLKEMEQKAGSKKQKVKNQVKSYGIEISNKISDDSAYGSLNRNTPNPKTTKLSPLQRKRIDSASSSGSENFANAPVTINQKMSKFCHECGNKYPLNTAKFCVECGVKRLVL